MPGPRPIIVDEVNSYAESIPLPRESLAARNLTAEAARRGIVVSAEDARYLSDDEIWPARVTGELLSVIEACEAAGVRFRIEFSHEEGYSDVANPFVTISLVGP